jgi:magnesium-transporting ATPase (P-type)
MLTGDSPATAESIAHEVGILDQKRHPVISGHDIDRMDDETLRANVAGARVFARVAPEHKLRIVEALQKRGEVVAMTGDGVNDMAALRAADVGVAMGKRGTEAAKEAGDVILADDDFRTIVDGVKEGRRIRDNLDRVLFFLLSASFAEMLFLGLGFLLLLSAFGQAHAPLNPVQILWVNLATGALIAVPLMLERAEPDSMNRPPRRPQDGLLSSRLFIRIMLASFAISLAASVVFIAFQIGGEPARASTLAFATIMVAEWFVALSARSLDRPTLAVGLTGNRWLLAAIGAGVVLAVAAIQLPFLQPVFGTVALTAPEWGLVLALGSTPFWALECYKALVRALSRRRNPEPAT